MPDKDDYAKLIERLESIEKSLAEKDQQIKSLETQNREYASKIANLKVEGLAKQVDEVPEPKVEEEITFDFDLR